MSRRTIPAGVKPPEHFTPAQRKQIKFLRDVYKRASQSDLLLILRNAEETNNIELIKTCQILIKKMS